MKKEITSKEVYDKIICKVNLKYGAPMGRGSDGEKPTDKRVFCRSVPLTEGYDAKGCYWGSPGNLFVEYTKDMEYMRFFRKDAEYIRNYRRKHFPEEVL